MYIDKGVQPESRNFSVSVGASINKHRTQVPIPGNQVPFNQCIQLHILTVCSFLAVTIGAYDKTNQTEFSLA